MAQTRHDVRQRSGEVNWKIARIAWFRDLRRPQRVVRHLVLLARRPFDRRIDIGVIDGQHFQRIPTCFSLMPSDDCLLRRRDWHGLVGARMSLTS